MKKKLIINAHQKFEGIAEGKLNKTLADVIKQELEVNDCEVKLTYIENGFDADEEAKKHL